MADVIDSTTRECCEEAKEKGDIQTCSGCDLETCTMCWSECGVCRQPNCPDCTEQCGICSDDYCSNNNCGMLCMACDNEVCLKCGDTCNKCDKPTCNICRETHTTTCIQTNAMVQS